MTLDRSRSVLFVAAVLAVLAGCRDSDAPDGRPETLCTRACVARAGKHCSHDECVRGCRFALDRLLEHEGDTVVQCVAQATGKCDDNLFADCAAKVGEHKDGGPPGPKPPEDE
jgi:hypothetical protein